MRHTLFSPPLLGGRDHDQLNTAQHAMNPEVVVKLQMRDGGEDCTDCFTGCVLLALE